MQVAALVHDLSTILRQLTVGGQLLAAAHRTERQLSASKFYSEAHAYAAFKPVGFPRQL